MSMPVKQITMPPILYLPCFDYQVHRQRPQQLLTQLSLLGFNVIYCNVTQDPERPFVILNDHLAVCQDVSALNKEQPYIMWLTHGPYAEELHKYNIRMVVSDLADVCEEEFAPFAVWEQRKLDAADLVLCSSDIIYEGARPKHPEVLLLRNAADAEHFVQTTDKAAFPLLPYEQEARNLCRNTAPVIGFWGAVASWLDYDLIRYLAKERPQYQFVFIGQISCRGPELLGPLPNVHWLGNRDYEALPAFARQLDAAIVPFQVRKVTEAANPVKLYEYLAAGLPIISTDLPEVAAFIEVGVRIGRSPAQFLRHMDEALVSDRTPEKIQLRQAVARQESWTARARLAADHMIRLWLKKAKPAD
ncbi:glycosyltransferase [Paenibacillus rigui]|uniref:Glycosyl transferase n=1 Tax=Paenibacillus rigui TaxID=554312 RepID=A0A229UNQ9_9BACL|nr:glycosyltransferase [Paenibacillus rigui]OXM85066.1 hypothetical protein CF651_15745 [Paenibacillus rigui]